MKTLFKLFCYAFIIALAFAFSCGKDKVTEDPHNYSLLNKSLDEVRAEIAGKWAFKFSQLNTGIIYQPRQVVSGKTLVFLANDICVRNACFVAGTPITMANGSYKKIEDIKVGDTVKTYDEKIKKITTNRVKRVFAKTAKRLLYLSIGLPSRPAYNDVPAGVIPPKSEGKQEEHSTLWCTPEHPFYVQGRWKKAADLEAGDSVMLENGKKEIVLTLFIKGDSAKVYNFEVNKTHTYFAAGILVHNSPALVRDLTNRNLPIKRKLKQTAKT